jgi:tRNA (cmo5U34)-methyltransferase
MSDNMISYPEIPQHSEVAWYSETEIAQVWDAAAYDAPRRRLIPAYDLFYGRAADLVARTVAPTPAPAILDLGAGTGLLAAAVLERCPQARMTLFDGSPEMLDHARERFAGRRQMRFEVGDLAGPLAVGPWDAVVSALAIHHLDDDRKRALFARVHAGLRPGGIFVNAEQVAGPSSWLDARYQEAWCDDVRALGATVEEIAAADRRMEADRCAPVDDQLRWLAEAGFEHGDCWMKDGRFAVLAAWTPVPQTARPDAT